MSQTEANWILYAEVVSKLPGRTIWVDKVSFDRPIYNGSVDGKPPRAVGGYPSLESYLRLIDLSERDLELVQDANSNATLGPCL